MPLDPPLTDAERAELHDCLDAGRPFPERYRARLFAEASRPAAVRDGTGASAPLDLTCLEHVGAVPAATWRNRLIHGENGVVLDALTRGPLRESIDAAGGVRAIYVDPPFDVGSDFTVDVPIGAAGAPLREIAYRDTWGDGAASFLAMMTDRLRRMHALLSDHGSMLVHCDWRTVAPLRLALDEIFGRARFVNEIVWRYGKMSHTSRRFPRNHDTILFYAKGSDYVFHPVRGAASEYRTRFARVVRDNKVYWGDVAGSRDKLILGRAKKVRAALGRRELAADDVLFDFDVEFKTQDDVFTDISIVKGNAAERVDYPTQKPVALLERLIGATTNPGDLVVDVFAGSGTTAAAAQRLGRRWIAADVGTRAVTVMRRRLEAIVPKEGDGVPPFDVLSSAPAERRAWRIRRGDAALPDLAARLLVARRGCAIADDAALFGRRGRVALAAAPLDRALTAADVATVVAAVQRVGLAHAELLACAVDVDAVADAVADATTGGVQLRVLRVPHAMFDERVDATTLCCPDVRRPRVDLRRDGATITVALTDVAPLGAIDAAAFRLPMPDPPDRTTYDVAPDGIVELRVDRRGRVTQEPLTSAWSDWIESWAIDAGDGAAFAAQWDAARVPRTRELVLRTPALPWPDAARVVRVRIVDCFGHLTDSTHRVPARARAAGVAQ